MYQTTETPVSTEYGFRVIARRQRLQRDIHAAGPAGIESLLTAHIAMGIGQCPDLQDAILEIAGPGYEDLVARLLMERENISWARNGAGEFVPYL